MSSKEIAELTGKELSNVHRDIRNMLDALAGEDDSDLKHVRFERDARAYTVAIHLPKSLSITLVTGYNVVLRNRIIRRWQELETQAAAPVAPLPNFNNPAEAARAWALAYEQASEATEKARVLSLELDTEKTISAVVVPTFPRIHCPGGTGREPSNLMASRSEFSNGSGSCPLSSMRTEVPPAAQACTSSSGT